MVVYEDFTRYTEYDPNSNVSVGTYSITTTALRRDASAYVRRDYGTPAQFGDFTHYFQVKVTSIEASALVDLWMLTSNATNNTHEKAYTNTDGLCIYAYQTGATISLAMRVFETGGGIQAYAISTNTNYYITTTRVGTTWTMYIYGDAARTTLLSTLTRTCTAKAYRYMYPMASRGSSLTPSPKISAILSNLDLNIEWTNQTACELGGCYWWADSCHEGPRFPYDDLASGYLAQFQNVVPKGIYSTSGDYRTIEVNASGHVLTDIEIDVSSGLHVIQESGAFVQISGQHVYVESGVYVASGIYDGIATVIKTDAIRTITADSGGEVLHSGPILSMTVKALSENTSDMYLGGVSPYRPYSGFGFQLGGGESKSYDVYNFDVCYLCATTSGDKVTFDGINA